MDTRLFRPLVLPCLLVLVSTLTIGCGPSKVPEDKKDAAMSELLSLAPADQRRELLDIINDIEGAKSPEVLRDLIASADAIIDASIGDACGKCKTDRDRYIDRCGDDALCIKRSWHNFMTCIQDCG